MVTVRADGCQPDERHNQPDVFQQQFKLIEQHSFLHPTLFGNLMRPLPPVSGTTIYIQDLRDTEIFSFLESQHDIQYRDGTEFRTQMHTAWASARAVPCDYSLRKYVELMYLQPRCTISIFDKPVENKGLMAMLTSVKTTQITPASAPETIKLTIGYCREFADLHLGKIILFFVCMPACVAS
jgi:hypothetical protein